jgi:sugar/nucleoside kinase (ribokinase family)
MLNIIAIGSATRDIFINAENLKKGGGLCFPLGGKIELENLQTFSGGGGVNAATAFALQELKTGFCGIVGQDLAGQMILDELNSLGIDTQLAKTKASRQTDSGIIFHAGSERTILLYHSVSRTFSEKDIDWQTLKNTQWIYIAPLWGKAANLTEKLISFAKYNRIKVSLNPSLDQLKLKNIKELINKINVLFLNDDEASFLTNIKPYCEKPVFSSICSCAKLGLAQDKIAVITKGKQGAAAFDGKFLYQIPAPKVKVVDATGAGDSFGSGFVAGLIQANCGRSDLPQSWDIERALRLAMANAISNIRVFGANQGLLKKGDKIHDIKITKQTIN